MLQPYHPDWYQCSANRKERVGVCKSDSLGDLEDE